MSVHWPILKRCLRSPLRPLITDDLRTYRAGALVLAALNLADDLRRWNHTQTLGLLLPTGGLFPIAALAGWMAGKTVVPLNYLLKPDELRYVLEHCGTDTVITVKPMLEFIGGSVPWATGRDAGSGRGGGAGGAGGAGAAGAAGAGGRCALKTST